MSNQYASSPEGVKIIDGVIQVGELSEEAGEPDADKAFIYAKDDGAGKTAIYAKTTSGDESLSPVAAESDTLAGIPYTLVSTNLMGMSMENYTTIETDAYNGASIDHVYIGNIVTSIGVRAFKGSNLESISIPNSVTVIGMEAFSTCSHLPEITIPSSVVGLGMNVFNLCTSLQTMYAAVDASVIETARPDFLTKIYYKAGTEGWTNPWYGVATEEWTSYPNPMP